MSRKPPQGTHKIESKKREAKIAHAAQKVLDGFDAYAYMEGKGGEDWERMKQDEEPDSDLYRKLSEEHGRPTVGEAWKHWVRIVRRPR
jgi:hypothetical protein